MAGAQWHVKRFNDALEAFREHERTYVGDARSKNCVLAIRELRWLQYMLGSMRAELAAMGGEPEEAGARADVDMAERTLESITKKFRNSCVKAT